MKEKEPKMEDMNKGNQTENLFGGKNAQFSISSHEDGLLVLKNKLNLKRWYAKGLGAYFVSPEGKIFDVRFKSNGPDFYGMDLLDVLEPGDPRHRLARELFEKEKKEGTLELEDPTIPHDNDKY